MTPNRIAATIAIAAVALWAYAATTDDTSYCYIQPWADGTWSGVNFNSAAGIPDDCTLAVWQDPNE